MTNTASCWTCRSRRRHGLRGRGRDSPRAWTTRVRCARTWNGRRRKSRKFEALWRVFPNLLKGTWRCGEEEAGRFIASSPAVRREQPAEPSDQRPESYLAACYCLGVPVSTFESSKTDFTFLAGRSRQRHQKSTPRSTARRARGTLPPSTRFAPSSIPCSGLLIATLCRCRPKRGNRAGGRAIVLRSRGVRFISFHFLFFPSSGEAQKRKEEKHAKRRKKSKSHAL